MPDLDVHARGLAHPYAVKFKSFSLSENRYMNKALHALHRNRLTIRYRPFYRRYPYAGKASWPSVDSRGCVDLDLGIFYNRVPKAANSSVISSIASMKYARDVPSKEAKKLFRYPSQLSNKEMLKFDSLYKFTFVRNPFSRTLSAYLDKVERKAVRSAKDTSFEDFLQYLQAGGLYANAHWAPQSSILLIPPTAFDFIGHIESLDRDLTTVLQRIQSSSTELDIKSVLSNATGADNKLQKYYTPDSVDIVRALYRQDFEILGYDDELE